MLDRLVRMLKGEAGLRREIERGGLLVSRARKTAFRRLNAVAPLVSETHAATAGGASHSSSPLEQRGNSIVRREAVLGNNQRVAGYVFSLVYKANPRVWAASTSIQRLYYRVLLRNLDIMGVQRLLEHRLAFVDVSASALDMPFIEALPPQGIVYVIAPSPPLARPDRFS